MCESPPTPSWSRRRKNSLTDLTYPDPNPRQLRSSPGDYLPFLDDVSEGQAFEQYCKNVEESAEWGGQVELQVTTQNTKFAGIGC